MSLSGVVGRRVGALAEISARASAVKTQTGAIAYRMPTNNLTAMGLLLLGNLACSWHLFLGRQFVVNDLVPFSPHLFSACVLPYEFAGLGRENPTATPGLCDFGVLSVVLGGTTAQHVFLLLTMMLAGAGTFILLRRIGHSWSLALLGAAMYEFAPALLNQFTKGGPGILFTAALIPLILAGFFPPSGSSVVTEGMRTGALIAVASYVNPQAPVLISFVLVPAALACFILKSRAYASLCSLVAAGTFLLATTPLLISLPATTAVIHTGLGQLLNEFRYSLGITGDWPDFLSAYMFVGAIPAVIGVLFMGHRRSQPAERAAAATFLLSILFWEVLRRVGPSMAQVLPFLALFKDFIKLQILISLPIVVLSLMVIRWATEWRRRSPSLVSTAALASLLALLVLPAIGQVIPALTGGQFGLSEDGRVPATYTHAFSFLSRYDPDVSSYRVLWLPMDGRVFHSFQSMQPNALVFRGDSSPDVQKAVLDTFHVVVNGPVDGISARLALQGVKYVIVDRIDGQPPGEPWQTGHPTVASVFNTYLLSGSVREYVATLDSAPGLRLAAMSREFLLYRNLEWRPVLSSYSSVLGVDSVDQSGSFASAGAPARLNWVGATGTTWQRTANGNVTIVGAKQPSWSPVSAVFPVVGGQDYLVSGIMGFENVGQAHAKVIWRGGPISSRSVSFLTAGRDGSASVDLRQVIAAPNDASSAELILMGGWAKGPNPHTSYVDVTVLPVRISPRLDGLETHPEQRVSLWREVPQLLLEPSVTTTSSIDPTMPTVFLTAGQATSIPMDRQVRLLTSADLSFRGSWGIDTAPDATGIEKFTERSSGRVTIPGMVSSQAVPGARIIWLEYDAGGLWPSAAVVRERLLQPGQATSISCFAPGCTIANLLVVPPLGSQKAVARLAYARSDFLKTPDGHRPPRLVEGDWAAIYSPPPAGYPSAANDSSSLPRWLSLSFGHLVIFGSLAFGWVRRLW